MANPLVEIQIIESVKHWLEAVVIGQQFCPFAQKPFAQDTIAYHVNDSQDWADIQTDFTAQLHHLHDNPSIETTLFILDWQALDFYDYLDGLTLLQQTLENEEFEGIFQIASFHPDYQFDGEKASSPSHFTNRAPLPIYHILREESLTKILDNMPNAHTIPEDNIDRAHELGTQYFTDILAQAQSKLPR